ncbi:calcium permeable stress-gated cation channel 1 [Phtheirospermum japonicum]|uniref:Calcium permeable stress-gated cation channel 1 n=1 Tax=Phtheirospermum japonicum TaxID=374723 RepID=A0A830BD80_9LAMI|nr:calcium permeable stress-gated cation channel 1 [Phtheirospermum japonicum]
MATFGDIGLAAGLNILSALIFLIAFAVLRLQPFNDRVYFPKWYLKGLRNSPTHSGALVSKFVNLDWRSYIRFLNWVPDALKMPEAELIDHAGLDSAVYLRIYLLGLKIFVPMTLLAWAIIVPVNWTNNTLAISQATNKLEYSDIDKLSISNIPYESKRFWTHIVMAYVFTFWTCYTLMKEYEAVAAMRLHFLASERRRPDQFTVLVKNVPPDADESVSECVEHFFLVNHPDHYLTHQVVINANKLAKLVKERKKKENWLDYYQLKYSRNQAQRPMMKTGFLGLCGDKVDAIDYQTGEIERLSKEIDEERERVKTDPKCIMPAAFVSFKTRWGAAVCAQTTQSRNPTLWLTEWATEPRDVYWNNLAIPYVSLTIRRLIIAVAFFFLTFFFIIPITAVQSLANIEAIEKRAQFLRPIIEVPFIKSFIQGVLPGLALKIFLIVLPTILMMMSKFEGFLAISVLERRSALRYYIFNFVNVFLVSVIAGSAMQQLNTFIHSSPRDIPRIIGVAIPMKATFFITYVMIDGWAGVAGEILRLKPLIFYHLKNFFLVKTEKDREAAMDPGSIGFNTGEPQIQLYFLLGLVYSVVTPVFLPFILVFFGFAYLIFRHQVINVYNQEYESAAAFWPDVHGRIVIALMFSQIVLLGLMGTKGILQAPPLLIVLVVLTFFFHRYCKGRYEPAFVKNPLQEAMMKGYIGTSKRTKLEPERAISNTLMSTRFSKTTRMMTMKISTEIRRQCDRTYKTTVEKKHTRYPAKLAADHHRHHYQILFMRTLKRLNVPALPLACRSWCLVIL